MDSKMSLSKMGPEREFPPTKETPTKEERGYAGNREDDPVAVASLKALMPLTRDRAIGAGVRHSNF